MRFPHVAWLAALYLGGLYRNGRGVEANNAKAFNYYLVAASNEDGDSCTQVGLCLQFGTGIEQNVAKAVTFFKKGYEAGSIHGRTKYGSVYFIAGQFHRTLLVDLNF